MEEFKKLDNSMFLFWWKLFNREGEIDNIDCKRNKG